MDNFGQVWWDSVKASIKEFKDLPGYFVKAGEEAGEAGKKIADGLVDIAGAVVTGVKEIMPKDVSVGVPGFITDEFKVQPETTGPKIGEKTVEGWFYIGTSEATGAALYAAPVIEQLTPADAATAAEAKSVRIPTRGELRQLFAAQSVIGAVPYKAHTVAQDPKSKTIQIAEQNNSAEWCLSSEEAGRKVVVKNIVDGVEAAVRKNDGRFSVWFVKG